MGMLKKIKMNTGAVSEYSRIKKVEILNDNIIKIYYDSYVNLNAYIEKKKPLRQAVHIVEDDTSFFISRAYEIIEITNPELANAEAELSYSAPKNGSNYITTMTVQGELINQKNLNVKETEEVITKDFFTEEETPTETPILSDVEGTIVNELTYTTSTTEMTNLE